MPTYVAGKGYYRSALGDAIRDVSYFVPSEPYRYDHPEGTGHDVPPFASMWFCGVGRDVIEHLRTNTLLGPTTTTSGGTFLPSFDDLVRTNVISIENRPNPRQRKKRKRKQLWNGTSLSSEGATAAAVAAKTTTTTTTTTTFKTPPLAQTTADRTVPNDDDHDNQDDPPKKVRRSNHGRSRYRDKDGKRTKKRF
jgi:hypothetical protein